MDVVLDGYESVEVVPSLFVLMGNFCSRPCNLAFNSFEELRSDLFHEYNQQFYSLFAFSIEDSLSYVTSCRLQFGKLGEMIASRTRLKEHSRFLFIPGPDDAGILKLNDTLLPDNYCYPHVWFAAISNFILFTNGLNLAYSFICPFIIYSPCYLTNDFCNMIRNQLVDNKYCQSSSP